MPGDEFDSDHAKTDHGVEYAGDQGSQTPGADTQPAHEAPPGRRPCGGTVLALAPLNRRKTRMASQAVRLLPSISA